MQRNRSEGTSQWLFSVNRNDTDDDDNDDDDDDDDDNDDDDDDDARVEMCWIVPKFAINLSDHMN